MYLIRYRYISEGIAKTGINALVYFKNAKSYSSIKYRNAPLLSKLTTPDTARPIIEILKVVGNEN